LLATRATEEKLCYTTASRGLSSLTLAYTTLDSCITYTYYYVFMLLTKEVDITVKAKKKSIQFKY